jgi:cell division protein FtsB
VQVGPARRECEISGIYSFRTSPYSEFSPNVTGRYAALKVLGMEDECICFVVLDGVFDRHPTLAATSCLPWLNKISFSWSGQPASRCVRLELEIDLEEFHHVGTVALAHEEMELLAACGIYGAWVGAGIDAEREWRWRNDRAAIEEEWARKQQAENARLAAARERYETRLKTLTWEKLLEEQPFARWDVSPPFPPPEFVAAARARIRSLILDLQALGPKPKKAQVRALLKICVERFNTMDEEHGNVIETIEREDICSVLEELAFVARHPTLSDEIGNWRDW